jgi:hypothetical protein
MAVQDWLRALRIFEPAAPVDPQPSLAKMESCRWPATLKEEKRPLATQNPYFHSGDGNAAETDIEIRPMSVADRPRLCENASSFFQSGKEVLKQLEDATASVVGST